MCHCHSIVLCQTLRDLSFSSERDIDIVPAVVVHNRKLPTGFDRGLEQGNFDFEMGVSPRNFGELVARGAATR